MDRPTAGRGRRAFRASREPVPQRHHRGRRVGFQGRARPLPPLHRLQLPLGASHADFQKAEGAREHGVDRLGAPGRPCRRVAFPRRIRGSEPRRGERVRVAASGLHSCKARLHRHLHRAGPVGHEDEDHRQQRVLRDRAHVQQRLRRRGREAGRLLSGGAARRDRPRQRVRLRAPQQRRIPDRLRGHSSDLRRSGGEGLRGAGHARAAPRGPALPGRERADRGRLAPFSDSGALRRRLSPRVQVHLAAARELRESARLHARSVPGSGRIRDGEARSHRHRLLQHRPSQPQPHCSEGPKVRLDAPPQPRATGKNAFGCLASAMCSAAAVNSDRTQFSKEIAALGMKPLWERVMRLKPGTAAQAAIWRWKEVRPLLARACELITAKEADRRVLMLENPALPGTTFITPALFAGVQAILPNEIAPTHRHTPNALRFIIEGEGAYTAIDGERIAMRPGDFVVTPGWTWHHHGNLGTKPVVWLDGLDTAFANLFGAHFREDYPEESQPVSKPAGVSPILSYPYERARQLLEELAKGGEPHSSHGWRLRYLNPVTGGDPFPTLTAFMQQLPKGFAGRNCRSTDGAVYCVVEGQGSIAIGETHFEFAPKDVFVVPSWERYRFAAK